MRMQHLQVPTDLYRGCAKVRAAGPDRTGSALIELASRKMGFESLAGKAILDVGCGVRFAQAIINRGIEVGSYTGVDVCAVRMQFLRDNVEDDRFSFHHWPVYNEMYHLDGEVLTPESNLPLGDHRFDIIWLFSVFTHLSKNDAAAMLHILRRYSQPDARLFFSAFIDPELEDFEDRVPDQPLLNAYFGESLMRRLVTEAGWELLALHDPDLPKFIQHHLVCRPAR